MKLLIEDQIVQEVLVEEDENKQKNYFIEGVWIMTEQPNRNNRIYKFDHMKRVVDGYRKNLIEQNRAFGELSHPDSPSINLDRVSHMITKLDAEGKNFVGRAKILNTPTGNIVKGLLDGGAKLGVSTRGVGSLKPMNGYQVVQEDFQLATAGDIVANPSAHIAFVNAVMEDAEWLFENGEWIRRHETAKKKVRFISKRRIEEESIKLFEEFVKTL
jgi:hypothetical protein